MLTFDFEIVYKKGSEMPADFLSRNMVVDSISFDEDKIRDKQMLDPRLVALKKLLYSNTLPQYNLEDFRFCKLYQNDSFIDNRILYRRVHQTGEPDRVVLFSPPTMRDAKLQEAHGAALSGHGGTLKTKEQILQSYFWPGMDQDIQTHLKPFRSASYAGQEIRLNQLYCHHYLSVLSPTKEFMRIFLDFWLCPEEERSIFCASWTHSQNMWNL